ncbi:recombination repair and ssDNA binding protein [Erwinia phage Cronus]|uniref:Recombination repair and ssDNA binding protein n=1 Tax=Erwinia phage Cronus TaxID=2163633 RepID=A0A2S1GLT0_9CAUD|nr:recombination repair and ssDNA binding protein [Erwinia phage Cronus]AWD90347.1 recombination repair and ssDNA binding protein [Erwinia phage Cronus]
MKLEDLQDELDADLKVDHTKLQLEASQVPTLYGKWSRYHSSIRKEILKIENQRKTAVKKTLDYYTGRGDEVCMDQYEKSEMKVVISANADVLKVDTALAYWGIMLEFCSKALDAVKSKGFAIKHIIDLRAFEAGA